MGHLQEKLLVVGVRDQSSQLTIDARGESKLCVRLRLLTGRSSLLPARQVVKIALKYKGARIIDIAMSEFKRLKALLSGLVRDDHERVQVISADSVR